MQKSHLKPEMIRQWLDNELDQEDFHEMTLSALLNHCSDCQEAWKTAIRERVPGQSLLINLQREAIMEGIEPGKAAHRAVERVLLLKKETLAEEASLAEEALPALLAVPEEYRGIALQENEAWSSNLGLAMLLLGKSRASAVFDPAVSRHFAELAEGIAKEDQEPFVRAAVAADLRALAKALHGNALRIDGDYQGADASFREALEILRDGSGDPSALADVLSYQASLLRDEINLPEAENLVRRSVSLYKRAGKIHLAGRAQMKLGLLEQDRGEGRAASITMRIAIECLDFQREPLLQVVAFKNLAWCEAEAGNPTLGLEILDKYVLNQHAPERIALHVQWAQGKIMVLGGDVDEGIELVRSARQGFIDLGDVPNAAASTVDLALICARAGRVQDVRHITMEALPLLLPLDLPDAAMATFLILEGAAVGKRLSVDLLKKVQESLRKPSLWRRGFANVN